MKLKLSAITTAVFASILLTACGGGGSSGSGSVSQPIVTPSVPTSAIQGDTTGTAGQSMGLAFVASVQDNYDAITWTQTAGATVDLTSQNQPVISFVPPQAGTYSFTATVSKNGQVVRTLNQTVTVSSATVQPVSLRTDKSVGSGGTVSVRFYTPTALTASQWSLVQTAGTAAKINFDDKQALANITVPKVTSDQLLTFKATSKLNPTLTDSVNILVKANNSNLKELYFCNSPDAGAYCLPLNALTTHHPYMKASKYAPVLTDCVMSNSLNAESACTLKTLPFIGSESMNPTVEQIMSRVVVSHDWMGKNFENFLRNYDKNDDFKRLLRSTTAIVISENVRPSFYWGGTGTIYLDPDYLWMTPQERDDIPEMADYRSSYSNGVNYIEFYDYEKNGESVLYADEYSPDINLRQSRSLDTLAMPLASLLYHELSHANDYMPITAINSLTAGQMMGTAYDAMPQVQVSTRLGQQYPLSDNRLKGLAQVEFGGEKPTALQSSYSPAQVGDWFFADKGTDMYNFYNSAEDLAMTFEESMMLSRFGVNRYFMFMTPKTASTPFSVARGYKNWISAPAVKSRAEFVVNNILPEALAVVNQKLSVTSPTPLCAGTTLFSYFNTNCSTAQPYPYANAYFGHHGYNLPKAPTRGASPISGEGMK